MGVAFVGVGLGAWFQRRGLDVLAEPLRRTGELLPVVVMVGFWMVEPPHRDWDLAGSTPVLWLLMAGFYGLLGVGRKSVLLCAVAIFAGSVGLWVTLHRQQLDFITHPQLWLIPPGLALLVAEQLDRRRLSAGQRTALRYAALTMIYVSSTTEFMRGVGDSLWLPLTLIGLSTLGVAVGVWLRIRSYVYLGTIFTAVVIVRMIFFAAFERGQTWLFWISVIGLGLAIIVVSALYERRRNELKSAITRFQKWEP
jgi:hypothetical protein